MQDTGHSISRSFAQVGRYWRPAVRRRMDGRSWSDQIDQVPSSKSHWGDGMTASLVLDIEVFGGWGADPQRRTHRFEWPGQ